MNNSIEVKVTTKHFKNATKYTDNDSCPLALAVRDIFPNATYISVCFSRVLVDTEDKREEFEVTYDWQSGQKIYGGQFKGMSIDKMILLAKEGKRIPTKTLVLEKINLVD